MKRDACILGDLAVNAFQRIYASQQVCFNHLRHPPRHSPNVMRKTKVKVIITFHALHFTHYVLRLKLPVLFAPVYQ
jgi:hypothetical protein